MSTLYYLNRVKKILTYSNLYNLYYIKKKSICLLSKELHLDRATISKYLDKYNIQRRTHKEANGLIDKSGKKNPCYRHGKCNNTFYIDCGVKIKNIYAKRCNSCDTKGVRSRRFGKVPPPPTKRFKYKEILMRSTWEVKYAKYLDSKNIKWLYEPKTFNLGNCTYTPDFYLPEKELYVEIKGFWRGNVKEKVDLFKKIYRTKVYYLLLNKKRLELLGVI